tara:strand:- start:1185 stop:1688 length:504 start_codon:yes stop_codon:yes gene_type:complete
MATHYAAKNPGNDLNNLRCAKGTVDIGVLGTIAADDVIYTGCKVPHGAIVTEVSWFVETVCDGGSSASGTWLLGWSGDSGVDNVSPARAMTIIGIVGHHYAEINSGLSTAGADAAHDTAVEQAVLRRVGTYHADAAGEELVLTLAGQTWTAGKVHFYAKYFATGDLA